MAELPNKLYLTSGLTTEAQFQGAIGGVYDVLAQIALFGPYEALTIASDAVTPTKCYIKVDNEAAAATDNLSFIVPTNVGQKVMFVTNTSSARKTTLKHNVSGTGKLNLLNAADVVLSSPKQMVVLIWNNSAGVWDELWRNFGLTMIGDYDAAAARTALSLGTAALVNTGISSGQVPLANQLGAAAFKALGVSTGQVPTADLLGALAFLNTITATQMGSSGVTPGTYQGLTVNAQGLVTGAVAVPNATGLKKYFQRAAGTYTFTTPVGTTTSTVYKVMATGSGGGGGSGGSGGSGGGGGAGGTAVKYYTGLAAGTVFTFVVGAGGAGADQQQDNATNGADTTVAVTGNTTMVGIGGKAGSTAASSSANFGGKAGDGGTCTAEEIEIRGGDGQNGQNRTANGGGTLTGACGGTGGASFYGSGGRGGAAIYGGSPVIPAPGQTPGTGGGGGYCYSNTYSAGADGAPGAVWLEYVG